MTENSMLVIGIIALVLITAGLTYYIVKVSTLAVPPLNVSGQPPTITVTGEASRSVTPDLMTVGLTISTMGSDTAASQSKNAVEAASVKAALLASGVNESEIQTVSYNTYPVYNESCSSCYSQPYYTYGTNSGGVEIPANSASPPTVSGSASGGVASSGVIVSPGYPSMVPPYPCVNNCSIVAYETSNSIMIKNGKTGDGGKYIEAALNASNWTSVDYVYFSLSDAASISVDSELQAEAASNAKTTAESIANGLGAHLGNIVSVNPSYPFPYPVYAYQSANSGTAAPAAPPTDIFPTTTDMSGSITVVYALVQ